MAAFLDTSGSAATKAPSPKEHDNENPPTLHFSGATLGLPLKIYPTSTIILAVWVVYIASFIWLLELSASYPTIPISQRGSAQVVPWRFIGLPTLLQTVFAQAHGPITAYHLSRLAVSALQLRKPWATPRTWRELIWSTDRAWQGPVGLLGASREASKYRVGVSWAFTLFTLISAVALSTPALLSRAYSTRTVLVEVMAPPVLSWSILAETMYLDAVYQASIGDSLWITGQSLDAQFNTSIYHLSDRPRPEAATKVSCGQQTHSSDFFFAHHRSDVSRNSNARLPGVRYVGKCSVVHEHVDNIDVQDQFGAICDLGGYSRPVSRKLLDQTDVRNVPMGNQFDWCGRGGADNGEPWISDVLKLSSTREEDSRSSALVWFLNPFTNPPLERVIECNAQLQYGTAAINRTDMTMANFIPEAIQMESSSPGPPLLHPVPAAMSMFHSHEWVERAENELNKDTTFDEAFATEVFLRTLRAANEQRLRLTSSLTDSSEESLAEVESRCPGIMDEGSGAFDLLQVSNLVKGLLEGTKYMAIAPSIISSIESEETGRGYVSADATNSIPMTVYTRSTPYLTAALATLAVWFILLSALTAVMLRPTFSNSLNSYATARLFIDRPELVEGYCAGNTIDNPKLSMRFPYVGSTVMPHASDEPGHIFAGGEESLRRGRKYAGVAKLHLVI